MTVTGFTNNTCTFLDKNIRLCDFDIILKSSHENKIFLFEHLKACNVSFISQWCIAISPLKYAWTMHFPHFYKQKLSAIANVTCLYTANSKWKVLIWKYTQMNNWNQKLVFTAFVFACFHFVRNFILGTVTSIRVAKLNLSIISRTDNFNFVFNILCYFPMTTRQITYY